jgi:hypothetical protein
MMMRAQTEILFFRWVTLTERKWVIFRERRSTHMSMIERGRLNIGVVTLKMIIDALEIKASEFFRGIE